MFEIENKIYKRSVFKLVCINVLLNRSLLQKSIDRLMYSRPCLSACNLRFKGPCNAGVLNDSGYLISITLETSLIKTSPQHAPDFVLPRQNKIGSVLRAGFNQTA